MNKNAMTPDKRRALAEAEGHVKAREERRRKRVAKKRRRQRNPREKG
jgi:hypothetical protein